MSDYGQPKDPNQYQPRFQVRPAGTGYPGYWEAYDTSEPGRRLMAPTQNQQQAYGEAERLNALKPKKSHKLRTVAIVVGSIFGGLVLIGILAPSDPDTSSSPGSVVTTADNGPSPDPVVTPTNKPSAAKTTAPSVKPSVKPKPTATQPSMTKSQEQAIGSAEQYLSFSPFSRKGLIEQLSSSAGDGYTKADATFAVDHITVNWNEQAAKAAKAYLEMSHFSRQGLIEQLESSAGDGYTHAQAVYGVNKAGL